MFSGCPLSAIQLTCCVNFITCANSSMDSKITPAPVNTVAGVAPLLIQAAATQSSARLSGSAGGHPIVMGMHTWCPCGPARYRRLQLAAAPPTCAQVTGVGGSACLHVASHRRFEANRPSSAGFHARVVLGFRRYPKLSRRLSRCGP